MCFTEDVRLEEERKKVIDSQFNGQLWEKDPEPIPYRILQEGKPADFPYCSLDFIVSRQVYETLNSRYPGLLQAVRIPVNDLSKEYYRVNLLQETPLDLEKSEVKRFGDNRVFRVRTYAFSPEKLAGLFLFRTRIEKQLWSEIFATEDFKRLYDESGWTGLRFKPVFNGSGRDLPPKELPLNGCTLTDVFLLQIYPLYRDEFKHHRFLEEAAAAFEFLCHCQAEGALQPLEGTEKEALKTVLGGLESAGLSEGVELLTGGADLLLQMNRDVRSHLGRIEFIDGELIDDEERANFTADEIEAYGRASVLLNKYCEGMDDNFRARFAAYMESLIPEIKATGLLEKRVRDPFVLKE